MKTSSGHSLALPLEIINVILAASSPRSLPISSWVAKAILFTGLPVMCALGCMKANAAAGNLDPDFIPLSLSATVYSVEEISSGRYLIGGGFQDAGGDADTDYVARLLEDGARDSSFIPLTINSSVYSVTALSSGKYLIGGNFTDAGNAAELDRIARLNSDGSRDSTFSPPSLNNIVYSTLEAPGPTFLIGGAFINVNSDGDLDRVIRLSSTGALDPSFAPTALFSYVRTIKDLGNGQFLIGGNFPNAGNDADTDYLAKLNSNGSRNTDFTPLSLNGPVYSVAALSDGKYLIGGGFTNGGGDTNTNYLARLNSNGSRDSSFQPLTLNNPVWSIAELSDGRYLIGGMFTSAGGDYNTRYLARINENGSRDPTFNSPTLNGIVYSVRELSNGNYLIGGAFTNAGGDNRVDYVAKILSGYPTPPELVSNVAGDSSAAISWTLPVNDGGSAITDYEYRLDGTGSWIAFGSTDTSATLSGLTNGTTYGVEVRAVNALGEGPPSNSLNVTPMTVPAAPTLDSATAGNGTAALAWTAPSDNGGSAITDYEYRLDGTGSWVSFGSTDNTATLTGLTNGTTYGVEVRAVNIVGQSPPSNSLNVTPMTVPDPPTLTSATPGNGTAALAWNAPADNGGSAITDYEYRLDGTGSWVSFGSTDNTATLTGLTNGTTYSVEVRAVNALGEGPPSNSLDVTPVAPTVTPQAASDPPVPVPINTLVGLGLLSLLLSLHGLIRINGLTRRH